MPRPKNYAFEKAQRERARLAKKAARKDARSKPEGSEDAETAETTPTGTGEGEAAKDKDPEVG